MSLHVERTGSGPDLVLLHGWGLHSGVWAEVMPSLAQRARVHAIDLPGHGYSADVEVGSFDAACEAVAAVVPERSLVCGWSLGGLVAQRIAHRHPDRVVRLALVSSTPCFAERPGWRNGMKESALATFASALAAAARNSPMRLRSRSMRSGSASTRSMASMATAAAIGGSAVE